jgi:hypothetical protein
MNPQTQTQNFTVTPNDKVLGGQVTYTADLTTGVITVTSSLEVKIFWTSHTFTSTNTEKVPADDLKSSALQKVDDYITVGDVVITVDQLVPLGMLAVDVFVPTQASAKISAVLDNSGTYLHVVNATARNISAPLVGDLDIVLSQAPPSLKYTPKRKNSKVISALVNLFAQY